MKNKLFSLLLVVLFVFGISLLVKDQEGYLCVENRQKEKIDNITIEQFFSSLDSVLGDQLYYRDKILNNFLSLFKKFSFGEKVVCYNRNQIKIQDMYLENSYGRVGDEIYKTCANKGYNINEISNKYPDIKTYVYIPVRHLSEPVLNSVWFPNNYDKYEDVFVYYLGEKIKYNRLNYYDNEINDLFYTTDIHYNVFGADKVYRDIVNMINEDIDIGKPKELIGMQEITNSFKGSFSNVCEYFTDMYDTVYLGEYDVHSNEYEYCVNGNITTIAKEREIIDINPIYKTMRTYDKFFGSNIGEASFDYNDNSKKNILIFTDSFIGPIKEVLSSHFNKTILICGNSKLETLNLDSIIKTNEIDIILVFWSQQDMFYNGYYFIPIN